MRPLLLGLPLLTLTAQGQVLFSEDFEGTPDFTLNTTDAGSAVSVWNTWVVNDSYTGGTGEVVCIGFPFGYTIVNTPAQPVGISSPNGNYLHTASVEGITDGITCCSFGAADGLCIPADNTFSRMSVDVSTVGAPQVELKFWWVCEGGASYYGQVYYSTNGGASWAATGAPAQYNFQGSWTEQSISLPDFGNQATLRFGFRFVNAVGLGAADPGFAVDDVRIVASSVNSITSNLPGEVGYFCQGYTFDLPFTAGGTFAPGNVFTAQLSDASGSFAAPVAIGSLTGTGSGTIACTIPGNTPGGAGYLVRVVSDLPAVTGTVGFGSIQVIEAPYAGENASIDVCSGADPFTMDLGGDPGGTWGGPSVVVGATYDASTMEPGTYSYFLPGELTCPSSSATLVITEIPGADAGISTVAVICKNTGIYQLFDYLGGTPDTGGTWTGPGGNPSDGTFNSNTTNGGIYTYTVDPGGACGADEAVVTVQIGLPGEAGEDGTWSICSNALPVDLYDLLDVAADQDGIWFSGGAPFNGEAEQAGNYVYIDYAEQPCVNDTAFIELVVMPDAYAGENGTAEVCPGDPPFALITVLGGTPQAGGIWTGPDGSPHPGIFNPGTDGFGLYTYTIPAMEPCEEDEAVVGVLPCVGITEQGTGGPLVWLGSTGGVQRFGLTASQDVSIEVVDATGRSVLARAGASEANGQLLLDTGSLGAGAYFLRVRDQRGARVVRFVQ
jgi:hypothetical protein